MGAKEGLQKEKVKWILRLLWDLSPIAVMGLWFAGWAIAALYFGIGDCGK